MKRRELETCIRDYGRDVYSFCCQLAGSRQEADDLYQDTFLKLLEVQNRVDIRENPKGYLLSVAVNLWRNRQRRFARRQRIAGPQYSLEDLTAEIADDAQTVEEQMISREETRLVREAVAELPEKYRLPVLLFYMEELRLSEIADVLDIPEGTVKSRLHKAKKLLEQKLEVVLNEKRH